MKIKIALLGLIAAGLLALPALSYGQDATNSPPVKAKHGAPFHGTVDGIDTNAMTLTVGSRTFQITSETHIMKDDKPAILADGVVGQPVTGYYKPDQDGANLDAASVYFGTHAKAKTASHKKKKAPAAESSVTNAPPEAPATSPVPPPPPAMTPPPPSTVQPVTSTNS
ncbi:MAG TPA: hypothetical protein VMH87_10955 [Pseudomonadales bacterium]|nr:hypothetical protein [Pseudomonadales bacterium]